MHKRFRATGTVLAIALTGSLVTATSATASPASSDGSPATTRSARAAGIDRVGGAYLGWSAGAHGGPQSQAPARLLDQSSLTSRSSTTASASSATSGVQGVDVSSWQKNVDWRSLWNDGFRFAYVKATEGNYYTNEYFGQQYNGSANAGMIRGAYHFANPSVSSGWRQARYFFRHGGSWSGDGSTLPGVLDIEYNPYGATCYGKTKKQMRSWISSFVRQYKQYTGRDAIIYTNYDWWSRCTGNTTMFNDTNPLWVARYASTPGTLPGGWPYYTFWQHTATPFDQNKFNGSYTRLKVLARGR
jgi:GH25 family lysozyme M1 (1,4-beta-N-acetylmuramidase)